MRSYGRSRAYRLLFAAGLIFVATALSAAKKHPPAQPLDLNAATAEQLQQVPGVGPNMAKAIVEFREKSGPVRRVEDLLAIRGITKQRLGKMRPYITVAPNG